MTQKNNPEDLIEFPCEYTFKAVGVCGADFVTAITAAAMLYTRFPQESVQLRVSAKGNYQTVSIQANLDSYQQLTNIYAEMKRVSGLKLLL